MENIDSILLDSVIKAKRKTETEHASNEQNYLNELSNYYRHLEKSPENFQGRSMYPNDFKAYLMEPYSSEIGNSSEKGKMMEERDWKEGILLGLKVKAGVLTAFATGFVAATYNPTFWILTVAGVGYAACNVGKAARMFNKLEESINDIRTVQRKLERKKSILEKVNPKDIDEVLIRNKVGICSYLRR